MTGRILMMTAALSLVAGEAGAELREPDTKTTFDEIMQVDGESFRCLGTGVRKILWVRAYAVAYCIEESAVGSVVDDWAGQTHGKLKGQELARALEKDGTFYARLAKQPADRLVVMKMTRDVSREKLAEAFEDSLSDKLPRASIDKLLGAIPRDARKGDVVTIRSKGPQVTIRIGDDKRVLEDDAIAKGLWDVWLAGDSVTPSLRSSLATETARRLSPKG